MGHREPQWRKALRERLARQGEPTKNTEATRNPEPGKTTDPWTLIACRNLCALMADKRDPIDAVLHEQLHAATVRKGGKSFVLTATPDGWRSHPIHLDLEQPLDMTVRLAKRLRALLDEDP